MNKVTFVGHLLGSPWLIIILVVGSQGARGMDVCSLPTRNPANTHLNPEISQPQFSPQDMKTDLTFLLTTLESVHPDLYVRHSKPEVIREFALIENQLQHAMTAKEFYLVTAPLLAKRSVMAILCFQPPVGDYFKWLNDGGSVFPFDVKVTDGHFYIKASYATDPAIAPGAELVAIDGTPASEILARLLPYSMGEREAARTAIIQDNFRLLLKAICGLDSPFDVTIDSGGKQQSLHVLGATNAAITAASQGKPAVNADRSPYSFTILENSTGWLNLRSFNDREKAHVFLADTFKQISSMNIHNLIIDLRENNGGDSLIGDDLLGYLAERPISQSSRIDVKVSKEILAFYRDPSQSNRKSWHYEETLAAPVGKVLTIHEDPIALHSEEMRFKGRLYVLTGSVTYSAAVMFAGAVKDYHLGTIVGEETGGLATQYADIYPFKLPHTGVTGVISHKRIVRPSGIDDGRGVLPDYAVSAETAMERAQTLIREGAREKGSTGTTSPQSAPRYP